MTDNIEEILSINDALKKYIVQRLVQVAKLVNDSEDIKAEDIEKLVFFSPAGDGYGSDNHCINFGFGESDKTKHLDIYEALSLMMSIKHDDPGYFERKRENANGDRK